MSNPRKKASKKQPGANKKQAKWSFAQATVQQQGNVAQTDRRLVANGIR